MYKSIELNSYLYIRYIFYIDNIYYKQILNLIFSVKHLSRKFFRTFELLSLSYLKSKTAIFCDSHTL